jgi:hypothetical protein
MAVSNFPTLGMSNHSEMNATSHALGKRKNKGVFDILFFNSSWFVD